MPRFINLEGKRFGRLFVLKKNGRSKSKTILWLCRCDCGNLTIVQGCNLKNGHTNSCGCLQKEKASQSSFRHGLHSTKTYHSWFSMIQRCYNTNNNRYRLYGGRGIRVCDEWKNFLNFFNDMGECSPGMSLDRLNTNGDYEPGNCKWSTTKEQENNKRNNRKIVYKGEEKTLTEWGEALRINSKTLHSRIFNYKWPIEKAFTTPVKQYKAKP